MGESEIKRKICEYLESEGFYTYLNIVTNKNGIADVTVISPNGIIFLIETKAGHKKLTPIQQFRKNEIQGKVGVKTFRASDLETVKTIVRNEWYLPIKGQ